MNNNQIDIPIFQDNITGQNINKCQYDKNINIDQMIFIYKNLSKNTTFKKQNDNKKGNTFLYTRIVFEKKYIYGILSTKYNKDIYVQIKQGYNIYNKYNQFLSDNIIRLLSIYIENKYIYQICEHGDNFYSTQLHIGKNKIIENLIDNILDGLNVLHKFELLHMDIKPQNIIYHKESKKFKIIDVLMLCDFNNKKSLITFTPSYLNFFLLKILLNIIYEYNKTESDLVFNLEQIKKYYINDDLLYHLKMYDL